jgi:hypothetical protein
MSGGDPKPPAPLRENPEDKDFDETDRKVSDQQGEVAPGSEQDDAPERDQDR